MFKIRNYQVGLDIGGLILFFIVMLPNLIWFAIPTANDILRNPSATPHVDGIASVFQVVMVASICVLVNKDRQKPMKTALLKGIIFLIALYGIGWGLYYIEIRNPAVILDLCAAPSLAFILFSIARKNAAALISASLFALCHVLYGIVNFLAK